MLKLLAFDFGASSGRAILGQFNGEKIELSEVHRFPNDPVMVNGNFYWDVLRLYHEMKQAMIICRKNGHAGLAGIGIDTWGVDFGLLDANGDLLGNPFHYRDKRTEGMIELADRLISKDVIYQTTGIAFMKFNSLYQLLAMKDKGSPLLDKAKTLLFMPDLLSYFFTGEKISEYTIASTSQMVSAATRDWARDMLNQLGIPVEILTDIIKPGTVIGDIKDDVAGELNFSKLPVIAVAGHDTGSAVLAVPAQEEKFAYLSSGTWSLMGVESSVSIINNTTYRLNYTNEGGISDTYRVLKNIMGLWIFQECKREWDKAGETLEFAELEALAEKAAKLQSFIYPDDDMFYHPGNMPEKVREYCRKTGQKVPDTKGEIVRCILESLALTYRMDFDGLETITGYSIPVLHIVGGGSKNRLLNRFTAASLGKKVVTGPVEATAIGNIAAQLLALGELSNIQEAREMIRNSFPVEECCPTQDEQWEDAYRRFKILMDKKA